MDKSNVFQSDLDNFFKDDEINISYIYRLFLRNKLLISFITILLTLSSTFLSLSKKNIWEGQFEIVLDNSDKNNQLLSLNSNLAQLAGLDVSDKKGSLSTEVGILESPSVLLPVYEYALSTNTFQNEVSKPSFSAWKKNNLNISLKQKTSILNIEYRDSNKKNIIPILDKISEAYQIYSGKSKNRNIELGRKYLNTQIKIYKNKSSKSIKDAQQFAMDQDLYALNISPNNFSLKNNQLDQNQNPSSKLLPNIGIENVRVNSANEIRNIDLQIKKIENLKNDYEKLQYIGYSLPGLIDEGLPQQLNQIENSLIDLRSKYTDESNNVKILLRKKDTFIKLLKQRAIGYLEAKKIAAQARMEAAMRPKGVILKYKELIREAARDEETLISLENQLRILSLEATRLEDPWELITKPTLKNNPVLPNRKLIVLIGSFIGLILGYLIATFKEKRSGFIYEEQILEDLLKVNVIEKIILKDNILRLDNISFFNQIYSSNSNKKIKILSLGEFNQSEIKTINNSLQDFCTIESKLVGFKNDDIIILLICLKTTKKDELIKIKRKLAFLKLNISGVILIEKSFNS